MVSEIITVFGKTDGSNTTGTVPLSGPDFSNSPTQLKLDKGLKAKIWAKRISGAPVKFKILYTPDSTAGTPVWIEIDEEDLASEGVIELEKRRPIIISFRTGNEAIRIDWEQGTAGVSTIALDIEIEPLESF